MNSHHDSSRFRSRPFLRPGAVGVVIVLALPMFYLASSVLLPGTHGTWRHLLDTVLPRYLLNSFALVLGVSVGVAVLGTVCAWIVATFEFPGRGYLEWAMLLPLAVPAYVIAYAYADFLQFGGPVQTALREWTGWRVREYWFPDVRSLPGAVGVFIAVLFPYVYLPVRAAFLDRSPNLFLAARLTGLGPVQAFLKVVLPMARPALAAGVALAAMETLADYGAVSYFAVETLTTGVFKAWFNLEDRTAASQLSCLLVALIVIPLWLEQRSRRSVLYPGFGVDAVRRTPVVGLLKWGMTLMCAAPVVIGFALPAGILVGLGLQDREAFDPGRHLGLMINSFQAAGTTAVICAGLALLLAYTARLHPEHWLQLAIKSAGLGYAVPGAVLAVAILVPLASLDSAVHALRMRFEWDNGGLIFTGSILALVYACTVRFLGIALSNVQVALSRVTLSMDLAARGMGLSTVASLWHVHLPLVRRGVMIGMVVVFVDALKELPATLVLRPFGFDTLATAAYNLAKDERLGAAAFPSLTIVMVGLLPVMLLSKSMRGRSAR